MVLNICNFIQRTEQVPVELDISAIEEYILLLLLSITQVDIMIVIFSDPLSIFVKLNFRSSILILEE